MVVQKIIEITNTTEFKNLAYKRTADFVDAFGPRLWGSNVLDMAARNIQAMLIEDGFDKVTLEPVPNVAKWVRGKESLTLFEPRPYPTNIPMIGLGLNIGGNVKAEVVVFKDIEDLEKNSTLAKGKIVLLNTKYTTYGETAKSRTQGASIAAKHGAVGIIIRSVTPASLETPHTGGVIYDSQYPQIPAAAISTESADMFQRMFDNKKKIVVQLITEGHYENEKVTVHNVVADFLGSEFPNEIILMGGHIDSWDNGPQTGANDDAAGFMVCLNAIRTLIKLGLRPRRTLRFIAWSGEEMGQPNNGAATYVQAHESEMKDHVIAFESDLGTRTPIGWGFSGDDYAYAIVKNVNDLFLKNSLNLPKMHNNDGTSADTRPLLTLHKVPLMRILDIDEEVNKEYYFTYHHSAADSVSILEPDAMDKHVMAIASMFYILGDLPSRIPRAQE